MQIGNVEINVDAYSGTDTYSDGPVEDELLNIVRSKSDIMDTLHTDKRWPILYHLHPSRENVLAWYDFTGLENVLEIGSGCGALTGLLARRCNSVRCIDVSLKRSQINAYRHQDCRNLTIYAGNYSDVKLPDKYDIATLIGVLEYAPAYFPARRTDSFRAMLQSVRSDLKPDGTVIIAIENKFGLKYWAGAREDHTGILYDSIEGYKDITHVGTFSKPELEDLIRSAGFSDIQFYYPYPDYKFSSEIYSDRYLPQPETLSDPVHNYDMERLMTFNERRVLGEIIRAGAFPFFSNSFLAIARNAGGCIDG